MATESTKSTRTQKTAPADKEKTVKAATKAAAKKPALKKATAKAAAVSPSAKKAAPAKKTAPAKTAAAPKAKVAAAKKAPAKKAPAKKAPETAKSSGEKKAPAAGVADKKMPAASEASAASSSSTCSGKCRKAACATPVADAARKAAEKFGIDAAEVDKAAEKFKSQVISAQSKLMDALNLVVEDFNTGAQKARNMADAAVKNLGVDTDALNEKVNKGFDEACNKAIDAAVTVTAELKKGLAGFRMKLDDLKAAAKSKKTEEEDQDRD